MRRKRRRPNVPRVLMNSGAVHWELEEVRQEVIALADLLEYLPSGTMEKQTPAGLSRLAWHIAQDIDGIQREIEKGNA